MAGDVRSLAVFQRAYALSLEVHRASLLWPKVEQVSGIASQIRRSSKAVCALLAEGSGRQHGSEREWQRYLVMALGSADETKLWCAYAHDLGYVERAATEAWQRACGEIACMLQGLLRHRPTADWQLTPGN